MFRIGYPGLRVGGMPPAMRHIVKGCRRHPEVRRTDQIGGLRGPSDVVVRPS